MQIICLARLITIISGINVNVLYAIGRTDLALKQQYIKLIIRIVFLVIAIKHGIIFLALAELVSTITHFFINTYYPGKILNYGSLEQIKDLLPIFFSSLLMVLVMYIPIYFLENSILKLIIAPLLALPVYLGLSYLLKISEFFVFLQKIKEILLSRK
jgi:O-antigen/teichoic acid export membrane protein